MSSPSPLLRHDQKLCTRRPPFVRIRCTSCLPSNLAVVGSLPAFISGEEYQGHYKYSLATTLDGDEGRTYHSDHPHPHELERTHLLRLLSHCTSSSSAHLEANPPQSRSRVIHRKVARTWVNCCVPFSSSSSSYAIRSTIRQTREVEFFTRTPEFEPLKGLRNPKSDIILVVHTF